MARLAHISDLHFGRTNDQIVGALVDDLKAFAPDVLVVSGDLTQRARRHELEAARAFLDSLPFPHVVVPGNHDVAPMMSPVERALRPWARFNSIVGETAATVHLADGTVVIGLNTVDPWRFVEGGVSRAELARVLIEAHHPADFRVLAAHHPLLETSLRPLSQHVRRHKSLVETFEKAKIDLVLTGHLHESFSGPAAARVGARHAVLAVQASTATSTRLRGHKNAWNRITIDPAAREGARASDALPGSVARVAGAPTGRAASDEAAREGSVARAASDEAVPTVRIDVRTSTGGPFETGGFALWRRAEGVWQPVEYERAGVNEMRG